MIAHQWPLLEAGGTRLASEWSIVPPVAAGARTLEDIFGSLVDELLALAGPRDDASVEVTDN